MGRDQSEFEIVAEALRDADLPRLVEEKPRLALFSFLKPDSQIHVLSRDFDNALSTAANAIQACGLIDAVKQTCHSCGAQCSAFFAACPYCKAILIVEQRNETESPVSADTSAMKYCPLCDAEYSAARAQCSVCGVELVPEELRGRPLDERQRKERIELVWRGGDPGAVSQVIETLRDAGIRHHVQPTSEHLVFELGMPRPKYAVRTFASDAARAKELLAGIYDTSPFVSMKPSALALAQEQLDERRPAATNGNLAVATVEVWNGDDEALAQLLEDCLNENRLTVRRQGIPPGILRLLVAPANEAFAREIIREVREASPPA